jgi:hypothetical protein
MSTEIDDKRVRDQEQKNPGRPTAQEMKGRNNCGGGEQAGNWNED